MDVLNTYGGETGPEIGWAIWFGICTVFFIIAAFAFIKEEMAGFAVLCVVVTCMTVFGTFHALGPHAKPIRHEVTLRDGFVIDATKYEIIEQRGDIYVIEERENEE